MSCWSNEEWARQVAEGPDEDFAAHLSNCLACADAWDAESELDSLVDEMSAPEPSAQADQMRAIVIAQSQPAPAPRPRRWVWAAAAVVLLSVGGAWWLAARDERPPTPPELEQLASVMPQAGARFERSGMQPDEQVRLRDGSVHFEVPSLKPGQRFRVFTDDAEVEVLGTAFTVHARDGRLQAVDVEHGSVRVIPSRSAPVVLMAGARWAASEIPDDATVQPIADATAPDAHTADVGVDDATVAAKVTPPARRRRPRPARTAPVAVRRSAPAPEPTVEHTVEPPSTTARPQTAPAKPVADPAGAAFQAGWAALRAGQHRVAVDHFRAAQSSPALAADAMFWRGVAQIRSGQTRAAQRTLKAFLQTFPSDRRAGEAAVSLGWIELESGRFDGAQKRFARGLRSPVTRVKKAAQRGSEAVRRAQDGASR